MSDPIRLDGATARHDLPLLFSAQFQKEVFINQALSVLDGLVHCAVEGEAATPPAAPVDGTAWLVAEGASGDWVGRDGRLALRQGGQWLDVPVCDGMQVLNRGRRQILHRVGGVWRAPPVPAAPTGGTVVDVQARSAINALVAALQQWGVFPG